MSRSRKQITFDLSQEKLKLFYPRRNSQSDDFYKKAYSDIQNFMLKNGFSHRQYSVYISNEAFTYDKINMLCWNLTKRFPWIKECVNEIDVTSINGQFSLKERISEYYYEMQEELAEDEAEFKEAGDSMYYDEGYEYDEEEPEL